jgi:hypothetical protein
MSKRFIKKDFGSGKETWRMAGEFDASSNSTIRRLSNKLSKKLWTSGSSIKCY